MSEAQTGGQAEFGERMLRMQNEAALALMVSVGHRTGLFDVMAATTTGRIVVHDGAAFTRGLAQPVAPGFGRPPARTYAAQKISADTANSTAPHW